MFKRRPSLIHPPHSAHVDSPSARQDPIESPTIPPMLTAPGSMYSRRSSENGLSVAPGRESLGDGGGSRTFVSRLKERTSSLHLFEKKPSGAQTSPSESSAKTKDVAGREGKSSSTAEPEGAEEDEYLLIGDGKTRARGETMNAGMDTSSIRSGVGVLESKVGRAEGQQQAQTCVKAGKQDENSEPRHPSLLRRRTIPRPLITTHTQDENAESRQSDPSKAATTPRPATSTTCGNPKLPLSASSNHSSLDNIPPPPPASIRPPLGIPIFASQRTLRSHVGEHQSTGLIKGAETAGNGGGTPKTGSPESNGGLARAIPTGIRRPATASTRLPRPNSIVPLRGSTSDSSVAVQAGMAPSPKAEDRIDDERSMMQLLAHHRLSAAPTLTGQADSSKSRIGATRSSMQLRPRTSGASTSSTIEGSLGSRMASGQMQEGLGAISGLKARRPVSMMMLSGKVDLGTPQDGRAGSSDTDAVLIRRASGDRATKAGSATSSTTTARQAAMNRLEGQGGSRTLASQVAHGAGPLPSFRDEGKLEASDISEGTTSMGRAGLQATPRMGGDAKPLSRSPAPARSSLIASTPTRLPRSVALSASTSTNISSTPSRSSPLRPKPIDTQVKKGSSPVSAIPTRRPAPPESVNPSRSMPLAMPSQYGPSPIADRLYAPRSRTGSPASPLIAEERDRKSSAASDIDARMAKSLARHSMTFDGVAGMGVLGKEDSPLSKRIRYAGLESKAGGPRGSPDGRDTTARLTSKASFSGLSAVSVGSEDDIRTTGRAPTPMAVASGLEQLDRERLDIDIAHLPELNAITASRQATMLQEFGASLAALNIAHAYDAIIAACEADLEMMRLQREAERAMREGLEGTMGLVEDRLTVEADAGEQEAG